MKEISLASISLPRMVSVQLLKRRKSRIPNKKMKTIRTKGPYSKIREYIYIYIYQCLTHKHYVERKIQTPIHFSSYRKLNQSVVAMVCHHPHPHISLLLPIPPLHLPLLPFYHSLHLPIPHLHLPHHILLCLFFDLIISSLTSSSSSSLTSSSSSSSLSPKSHSS